MDEAEIEEIRRTAEGEEMTVSEWVRQALREARRGRPTRDHGHKLAALRTAAEHSFPTADVGEMLAEIERGYVEESS